MQTDASFTAVENLMGLPCRIWPALWRVLLFGRSQARDTLFHCPADGSFWQDQLCHISCQVPHGKISRQDLLGKQSWPAGEGRLTFVFAAVSSCRSGHPAAVKIALLRVRQAHSSSAAAREGFGSAFSSHHGAAASSSVWDDADSPPAPRPGAVRQMGDAAEPGTVYRTPGSPSVGPSPCCQAPHGLPLCVIMTMTQQIVPCPVRAP